jgi:type IV secretory pathway VirB10-like protein
MSLSLFHPRLAPRAAGGAPALPRAMAAPWRDSASQQLDALEAANHRLDANRLGSRGLWVGLVAAALLLVAGTWRIEPAPVREPVRAAAAARVEPVTPQVPPRLEPAPPAAPSVAAGVTDAPPALDPALAAIDDAAQAASRTRAAVEARRKATRLAQERALAEADALRAAEREQAARSQRLAQEAAAQRVVAEAPPKAAAVPVAQAAPRGVRDTCSASGGFIAQQFCQSRECRKAEHEADAVCVRLREFEQARQRADR